LTDDARGRRLPDDWFDRPLPGNVRIDPSAWLYSSFAFCHYRSEAAVGLSVGPRTGLYHGTFFDLGPTGEVHIGEACSIVGGIFCTSGRVVLGDQVLVAHEVVIADGGWAVPPPAPAAGGGGPDASAAPQRRLPRAEPGSVSPDPVSQTPARLHTTCIEIGDNAWLAARCVVLGGARIGRDAIVGAFAVVDFEVPDGAIVAGNPAKVVGSVYR
jgi:acetyltransferase-like isoleucine patch superfamily enzyme